MQRDMMRTIRPSSTALALLLALGCGAPAGDAASSDDSDLSAASCGLSVTHNSYDGPNYWGTVTIKNGGASSVSGFSPKPMWPVTYQPPTMTSPTTVPPRM